MQLTLKELELSAKMTPVSKETASSTHENFDFTHHFKIVPPFQEHEVHKFFLHFKKIAANLRWPPELQTMLEQKSVLIGKAHEVYSAFSMEQSLDDNLVKKEILRAYELVPEAYLQRF